MTKTRSTTITFLVLLLVLSLFSHWQIYFLPTVEANPGWLAGWTYRKSHEFGYATGAGANYQIKTTVHYGSGSDSGGDVYCSSHCETDFGDIRFTDDDETTLLDYWIESKTDSNNAVFWVKVADDLSSSNKTIYMYYGKASETTTSNGNSTFAFFDDFTGASLDSNKWDNEDSAWTFDASNDYVKTATGNKKLQCKYPTNLNGYRVKFRWKDADVSGAREAFSPFVEGTSGTYGVLYFQVDSSDWDYYLTAWDECSPGKSVSSNTWYSMDERIASSTVKLYQEGSIVDTRTYTVNGLFQFRRRIGGDWTYLTWVAIGKFVDPEPTHGSWGSEEQQAEPNSVELKTPANAATETTWSVNFVFNATFYQAIQNASVYTNETGTWQLEETNSSVVNNGSDTTIAHSFQINATHWEGICIWNVGVWNSSAEVFATANRTLTVDVPPRYQSVGANATSVEEDGTVLCYAQFFDGIGVDYAWLSTNETGDWVNYTTPADNVASGFTFTERTSGNVGAHQGVAYDGTYFYTACSGTSGEGAFMINKYNSTWDLQSSHNCSTEAPSGQTQLNSLYCKDDKLYIGSNNWNDATERGYILVYNATDLSYIEAHQVQNHWCEGCAYNDGYWWVVYCSSNSATAKIVSKYNESWVWQADYDLTYAKTSSYWGYQGIRWLGDYIYVNEHDGGDNCDVYKWNGTGFEEVVRLDDRQGTQGIELEEATQTMWWAERNYGAEPTDDRVVTSAMDGLVTGDYYDSPFDCSDTADSWTWINFTWCNTSIPAGTTIEFEIFGNDTYGNVNGTGTQSFVVGSYEITIVTTTHSWEITPGQTDILITENTINITVSAPLNYDIQVKGSGPLTNGSNTIALSNVKVNYTGAAISLTTEYQDVPGLTDQTAGTDIDLTFQLWLTCPSPQPVGDYTYTLTVKIREHS